MATEKLPPITLPKAPSSDTDVRSLSRWARDLQRVGSFALQRIIYTLNGSTPLSGLWLPGITASVAAGTPTYVHRRGRWTLAGEEVTVWGDVELSNWTGSPSGNLRVHSLPFVHSADTPESICLVLPRQGLTLSADNHTVTGAISTNAQVIQFYEWGSAETAALIQAGAASTTLRLEVFARYRRKHDETAVPA